ncbi:MAG: DUF202 domain-containing protein [Chitinophagaceae bacterium]|jgi:putative membrane protein|nr:DUF202 domain-containing protein [Chitinophagaceae bacterium]
MNKQVNKDLILRENLAIERTSMAIERTFLSYLRTSLYFSIAGITINHFLTLSYGRLLEIGFWIIAFIILGFGFYRLMDQRRKLNDNRKHIGNYLLDEE